MARHYLEARWLSGQELPPFYDIDYRILPNLGGDLTVPDAGPLHMHPDSRH